MAGLGRKLFTAGEVLTAANVQGYLMDQAVMVFDDDTDRSTVLGTAVSEGMVSYLKNSNLVEVYDSAEWISVAPDPVVTSSTATAYTIQTDDAGSYLRFTNAGTVTVGTATDFTAGQQTTILADGTALTITTDGANIAGAGTAGTAISFVVGNQYEAVSVLCVDTDTYRVIGNISTP